MAAAPVSAENRETPMGRDELIPPPSPIPIGRPIKPVGDRETGRRRPSAMIRRRKGDEREEEEKRRRPAGNPRHIDEYA